MHNRRGGDPHPLGGDSDEGPLPNSHHFLGSDFFCYANLISSRIWLARVDLAAVRGVTFPRLCYVKRMYSPAFERQKWEKRHDFLIEQFDPVNIRDILGYIPARHVNNRLPWSPSNHPHLTVIPRRCGCMVRWFFLCPACGRRCEDLFPPYLGATKDLKCRICSNLIYASQRHGKRHPLRKTLTPRKRVSRQKSQARFQKIEAKHREKTRRLIQESQSEEYPDYDFPAIRRALESAIGGIRNIELDREANPPIRPLPGFSLSETEGLLEKVKETMRDLAQNAKSKRIRNMCKKELREHGWGYEEAKPEPVPLESPHRPGSNLFNLLKLPNVPAPKPASPNHKT